MRLSSLFIVLITFATAALMCFVAASFAATLIENTSQSSVEDAIHDKGLTWAEVHAEGLNVFVTGTAPTEAERFVALSTAGKVVDAARVIDNMQVTALAELAPPTFSLEILRNDAGISIVGLIPTVSDRDDILKDLQKLAGKSPVSDLLETADYPSPDGWDRALEFALSAIGQLPRSKISLNQDHVTITAMADSAEARRSALARLDRKAPKDRKVTLDISAPRPVVSPYTLRMTLGENGAKFDACTAENEASRARIVAAGTNAGTTGDAACVLGLGVPSPKWADAVVMSIEALQALGGGNLTFSDADISLIAIEGTDQAKFDNVVGALEGSLPEVFALHATLPEAQEEGAGPPEFIATLSPEGDLQMRGRLRDATGRITVESFAKARFGSDKSHMGARLDPQLPMQWPTRALAALEALSHLDNGVVTVTPNDVTVSGKTGDKGANAEVARLLSQKLGEAAHFTIDITYEKQLDPIAAIPKPETCQADISKILAEQKISFEPGSANIAKGNAAIDSIAGVLKKCGELRMEIQGHTDSQGREEMNQQLSQSRAQSVLNALRERRVLTSSLVAKGYGESDPVASNETEEGREANRRIEFVLIKPAPATDKTAPDAAPSEETSDDKN